MNSEDPLHSRPHRRAERARGSCLRDRPRRPFRLAEPGLHRALRRPARRPFVDHVAPSTGSSRAPILRARQPARRRPRSTWSCSIRAGERLTLRITSAPVRDRGEVVGVVGIGIPLAQTIGRTTSALDDLTPRQLDARPWLAEGSRHRRSPVGSAWPTRPRGTTSARFRGPPARIRGWRWCWMGLRARQIVAASRSCRRLRTDSRRQNRGHDEGRDRRPVLLVLSGAPSPSTPSCRRPRCSGYGVETRTVMGNDPPGSFTRVLHPRHGRHGEPAGGRDPGRALGDRPRRTARCRTSCSARARSDG